MMITMNDFSLKKMKRSNSKDSTKMSGVLLYKNVEIVKFNNIGYGSDTKFERVSNDNDFANAIFAMQQFYFSKGMNDIVKHGNTLMFECFINDIWKIDDMMKKTKRFAKENDASDSVVVIGLMKSSIPNHFTLNALGFESKNNVNVNDFSSVFHYNFVRKIAEIGVLEKEIAI